MFRISEVKFLRHESLLEPAYPRGHWWLIEPHCRHCYSHLGRGDEGNGCQANVAAAPRISFRDLMSEKRRCANCGTTKFGLIRHKWYRHQFCRKKCLDLFL